MRIVEAQGYSKDKAYATTGLDTDLDKLRNATISWKKAGAPINGKKLNDFFEAYIKEKKAYGAYIVIEAASDDTRLRPYSVINEVTKGARKYTTVYQIKPADLKVTRKALKDAEGNVVLDEEGVEVVETLVTVSNTGAVEGRAGKKDAAERVMKDLIKENKRDYVIELVKEVTTGQKFASYGEYTPSKTAEIGKFLFAVSE